jgi:hypothetical protein
LDGDIIIIFNNYLSPPTYQQMLYLMGTPIYLLLVYGTKDELNPINTKRDSMLLQTHAGIAKLV